MRPAVAVASSSSLLRDRVRAALPPLSNSLRKGQSGRVGVVGGSLEYTGAPFFSAFAALRCGADLAHVFCPPEAASAIKAYSGDVIVHPLMPGESGASPEEAAEKVSKWFGALDVLVVGPGLGREEPSLDAARRLISAAEEKKIPLVIDGDGLWALRGHDTLLLQLSENVLLTPNAGEYARLAEQLAGRPLGALVLRKGESDAAGRLLAPDPDPAALECRTRGSPRRCGGQGDVLTGAVAALVALAKQTGKPDLRLLAWGASDLLREASRETFAKHRRSMVATDVLADLGPTMQRLYPVPAQPEGEEQEARE